MGVVGKFLFVAIFLFGATEAWSQCGSGTAPAAPLNSWVGSVYDGVNNFTAYQGYITETTNFDESFCGDNCNFNVATGGTACAVNSETFTVRYRMQLNLGCGYYTFNIGGDDGVRLSLDNGVTQIINQFTDHGYTTYTTTVFLSAGVRNLVLDYYENGGQNRVTFSYSQVLAVTTSTGGVVAADQSSCTAPYNPVAFTSTLAAAYCSGAAVTGYQWQSAASSSGPFTDIGGATATTYDAPDISATTYYRRRATDGTTPVFSNTITVTIDPPGSETTAGTNSWIGHVYDGVNSFSTITYQGEMTESAIFDESFCGPNCTQVINGCDFNTETFTIRYRMSFTVAASATYTFTVGGDDGYRFTTTGAAPYLIDNFTNHSYTTTTQAILLAPGTYNFILDYYEDGADNRVTFNYSSVLPVTWSYFDGYFDVDHTMVEWRTAIEINNSGFVVERSTDGVTFDSLGFVQGNGNSNLPQAYQYKDINPLFGWNYYRVKQIDYDGNFEYSRLIPVRVDKKGEIAIYPNPASGELFVSHVDSKSEVTVMLKGMMTSRIFYLIQDSKQPSRFIIENVSPGLYVVTVTIDNISHTEKLVVL